MVQVEQRIPLKGLGQPEDGTWRFVLDRYVDNHRVRQQKGGYRYKAEAQQAMDAAIHEIDQNKGLVGKKARTTVEQFLTEWLEVFAKPRLNPKSLAGYRGDLKHVIERYGEKRLMDLTAYDVDKLFADMTVKGLSPSTIEHVYRRLKEALKTARQWQLIRQNVLEDIPKPKIPQRVYRVLSVEEAKRYLLAIREHPYYPVYLLGLMGGLRRGEAIGLQWGDINWDEQYFQVRRQVVMVEGKATLVNYTKTESSFRIVELPDWVAKELRRVRHQQMKQRLAAEEWVDTDFVTVSANGSMVSPDVVLRAFKRTLKQVNLPSDVRLHDLRHSHATLLMELGASDKDIAERLGHSSVQITSDLYIHYNRKHNKKTARLLEQFGPSESQANS